MSDGSTTDTAEDVIVLREEASKPIRVRIETIRELLLYIAHNKGMTARQIAWETNLPQALVAATLESIEEAHKLVLRGFVAVSTTDSPARWYRDLGDKERRRVPSWDGSYPSYHGPLPEGIRSRPDLHGIFAQGADVIFKQVFAEHGATPRKAKSIVSRRILQLATKLENQKTGRSFEYLSRRWQKQTTGEKTTLMGLEDAGDGEDDATIDLSSLLGFPSSPQASTPEPIAPMPSPGENRAAEPTEKLVADPPARLRAPAAPADLSQEAKQAIEHAGGRSMAGYAPSYTGTRAGRVAIMAYIDVAKHKRLKAWAAFTNRSMQEMASEAVEQYIARESVPELDDY